MYKGTVLSVHDVPRVSTAVYYRVLTFISSTQSDIKAPFFRRRETFITRQTIIKINKK